MNEYLREIFEIITIFPPLQSTAYLIPSGSIFNAPHGSTYRYKGTRCKVTKSNGETKEYVHCTIVHLEGKRGGEGRVFTQIEPN